MNLPKGYGYVEFKTRADAEKAQLYMDGVSSALYGNIAIKTSKRNMYENHVGDGCDAGSN